MSNELYHFGVQGMKWGVRRYQNEDGSYTQEGLRRYQKVRTQYEQAADKYGRIKGSGDKAAAKEAKRQMAYYKKESKKAYRHIKTDLKADKGKRRLEKGESITSNNIKGLLAVNGLGGLGAGLTSLAGELAQYSSQGWLAKKALEYQKIGNVRIGKIKIAGRKLTDPKLQMAMMIGGAALAGVGTAVGINTLRKNSQIRAYNNHKFYNRELQDWEKKKK